MAKTKPEKPVDENLLKKLASIMCTYKEMSDILGVSVDTLERRFADLIKEAQSTGKMSLRRWQFQAAEKGNPSMLIWLGKQILNQHEKIQHSTVNPMENKSDEELEKIILEASEKIRNGTRLIPSGKD